MYTKLLFIIAGFSLFLTGCFGGSNEMEPDSLVKAECIKGVYTGNGDFTKLALGGHPYILEVNHNSNEIIFLLTDTEREGTSEGSKVCTTYQNPSFYATQGNELLFNLEGSTVENNGVISHTRGIFSIVVSSTPQEEGESVLCNISQLKLYRPGDNTEGSTLATAIGSAPVDRPSKSGEEVELRSFDELKSECDALESPEQEVADNSDQLEEVDLQNPTQ